MKKINGSTYNHVNHSRELIMDFLLMLFGVLSLSKVNIQLLNPSNPMDILILFLIIINFIPWYMGYLISRYEMGYKKNLRKLLNWMIIIITLSLLIFLGINVSPVFTEGMEKGGLPGFFGRYAMFFLVLGPFMILGGYADNKTNKPETIIKADIATFSILLISVAIAWMIFFINLFDVEGMNGFLGFLLVFGAMFACPIATIICIIPFLLLHKVVTNYHLEKKLQQLFSFLIPIIIMISLILWNNMIVNKFQSMLNKGNAVFNTILLLCASGIIPFRIAMLLEPPFRWSGFIVGLAGISFYVYTLVFSL